MNLTKNHRMLVLPFLIGTVIWLLFLWVTAFAYDISITNRQQSTAEELNLVKQTIEDNIGLSVIALRRMAQRWEAEGGTPAPRWRADAGHYVNDNIALTAVQWIDPDYVVRLVEPLAGHEAVLGFNIAYTEERKQILQAAEEPDTITLTPPLDLIQGIRAFIAYVPIHSEGRFDGFIAGIYDLELFLDAILIDDLHTTHNVVITDDAAIVFAQVVDTTLRDQFGHSSSVDLFHRTWDIAVWPAESTYGKEALLLPGLLLFGGSIISLLVGVTVYLVLLGRQKRAQLERNERFLRDLLEIRQTTFDLLQSLSKPGLSMEAIANGYLQIVLSVKWLDIADFGGVYLLSPDDESFRLLSSGFLPEERKAYAQKVLTDRFSWTKASDRPGATPALELHPQTINVAEKETESRYHDFPIFDGRRLMGAVVLNLREGGLRDPEERQFLENTTDILAMALLRKISEDDLIQAKEKAEDANKLKSAFLATMSHELRTPLNGVIGATGLLGNTTLTETQAQYLTTVSRSSKDLLTLIDDILDYTQLESAEQAKRSLPFDLEALLSEVGERFAVRAQEEQLDFFVRVAPGTPRFLIGDPARIRQVLTNLCSNAFKFTSHGHVTLNVEAQEAPTDSVHLRLSVQDTGTGISAEKLAIIFDRFSQGDESATRQFRGTGLGLAISKKHSQILGGDITVQSEVGVGSSFTLTLQCEVDPQPPSSPTVTQSPSLDGQSTLLWSLNPRFREVVTEQLDALGLKTTIVDSHDEALAFLTNEAPGPHIALLILDHDPDAADAIAFAEVLGAHRSSLDLPTVIIPVHGLEQESKEQTGFTRLTVTARSNPSTRFARAVVDAFHLARQEKPLSPPLTAVRTSSPLPDPPQVEAPAPANGLYILVADDSFVNQMVAEQMLALNGCRVEIANDGQEAVEWATRHEFDAILMDCNMPQLDGYAATRAIRQREEAAGRPRVPIIAITANITNENVEQCRAAGMDDCIIKPFDESTLTKTLRKWVRAESTSELQGEGTAGTPRNAGFATLDEAELEKLRQQMKQQFPIVLEMFLEQGRAYVGTIVEKFATADFEAIRAAAHPLKSSSQMVGAAQMENIARELESLAERKAPTEMATLVAQLEPEFAQLEAKIQELIDGEDDF